MVPDPPDTIDLSGGGSGPWPAFTLTGATSATGVNTSYELQPYAGTWRFAAANGAEITRSGDTWAIEGSNATEYYTGTGTWPWEVGTWTPSNGAGGTLAFARGLAAPGSIAQSGADAAIPAELTTALTGTNNDLTFDAFYPGRIGNATRIRYVNPGTNNATLGVVVEGRDITVNLATNGSAQITSTAAQVKTALESGPTVDAVAELVIVGNAPGNNGSGVVTAMGWTNLSGGTGGTPLPPDTITL